jgi:hypothetical protein
VPSEHTTVVPEFAGTTTVVLFSGAGGLLLLMQPDSAASTTSDANMVFMLNPLTSRNGLHGQFGTAPACSHKRDIEFIRARYPSSVTSYSRAINGPVRMNSC